MPYAIELYFDTESTKEIQRLRENLEVNGISIDKGTKPHISLAIYEDLELEKTKEVLFSFSREINLFYCSFSSIGLFLTDNPVLFLAPVVTSKLLQVHSYFHKKFEEYKNQAWNYYLPENWVPHCTLTMDSKYTMLDVAIDTCKGFKMPMKVRVESIGLLEFKPNKQIFEFRLGD